jgi:hypothetical protein
MLGGAIGAEGAPEAASWPVLTKEVGEWNTRMS